MCWCTEPRCVLDPTLFSACMDWIIGRMAERSSCGASFGNVKISDLDFADNAVIIAEALDILLGALKVLNEESEPLELRVSWVKTNIQAFNDILEAPILSVPVCGEDVEVPERFTYLGSDIHVSADFEPEVNRSLGQTWGVMDSLDHGVWHCRTCAGGRKSESSGPWCFQSCSMDVRLGL